MLSWILIYRNFEPNDWVFSVAVGRLKAVGRLALFFHKKYVTFIYKQIDRINNCRLRRCRSA